MRYRWRMRVPALMFVVLSGCSLYFPHPSPSGDDEPPIDGGSPQDAPPIADAQPPTATLTMARCEDGQLYAVTTPVFAADQPDHGAGRPFGRCPEGCRSAAAECTTASCRDAAATLCNAPISTGATCPLDGTRCDGSAAIACPESTGCSAAVAGSSCTCVNNAYQCTQVTPAARTQSLIVGKWRGTVTTPGFVPPYPITLWIYRDGTYWPDCASPHCSAFYYGGDGPSPRRTITILSTSDTVGSWADIAIDFGGIAPNAAELSALVVDATTLRFTYTPSWSSCGRPFDIDLTRY